MYEQINTLIKRSKPPIFAVFDFDNTCIANDIGEAVLSYMARNDFPDMRDDFERYHALLDNGDVRGAYEFGAAALRGLSINEIDDLVRKTIEFEGRAIGEEKLFGWNVARGIAPRPKVLELIDFLQANGVEVWIVSASPELLVRSAMKNFGIKAKLIGVRNVIHEGKVTAEIEKPMPIIEDKVNCIKKFIHPIRQPLVGVGDSMNDLPMLEYSQIKAVVDRGNELAKRARDNKWFLI